VARWEPDARGRLQQAAFALFAEHGFENTTVAEIAKRAGLTERTFFRHFADKREVLFAGSEVLQQELERAVADAPESVPPIEAAACGVEAIGALLPARDVARQRQRTVAANAELQERELIKLASLSSTLAQTLALRGVDRSTATLTAEVAIALFRTSYERWIDEANDKAFPELVRESLDQLRAVTN
jgi:AcrR family transcriptional regulator